MITVLVRYLQLHLIEVEEYCTLEEFEKLVEKKVGVSMKEKQLGFKSINKPSLDKQWSSKTLQECQIVNGTQVHIFSR